MLPLFLFILSFSYITWLLIEIYDLRPVVSMLLMVNLLGSGGFRAKSGEELTHYPPWDSKLRPTLQRL
jgi:hypothetical protein